MSEFTPSIGSLLCWHLATHEARRGGFPQILPDHFFLALCQLPAFPVHRIEARLQPALARQKEALSRQRDDLERCFVQAGFLERAASCGALRERLGRGSGAPGSGIWHRSDELKALCEDAAALAREAGWEATPPCLLLAALLSPSCPGERFALLESARICPEALARAARDAACWRGDK